MPVENRRNEGPVSRNNFSAKNQRPAANKPNENQTKTTGIQTQNQNQNQKKIQNQKVTAKGSNARNTPNFMENFSAPVTKAEREVQNFLTEKPLATVAIALGVGLIGGFLFKKYRQSSETSDVSGGSNSTALDTGASLAFAGFLTKGLSGAISRVESEFGAFREGGLSDVRDSLTEMVTTELSERPFETIATAIGAGFGIANLEAAQMKNGAIRIAKTLAVRTLEGSGSVSLNTTQGENNVQA